MSVNVGEIDLELLLSSNKFNKQLGNVQNIANKSGGAIAGSFKKIGVAVAAAFSVSKIVSFSKECIELGSNIAEVQNVVDVAFKTMNQNVNDFANNAVEQFGLSQLVTKKYMGTFGAMSQAFGFTEKQAYEMSKTLTGLAGDVASFYNLSTDEAYTKLKSVFTGETESLKDLGVVMTQSVLDQYALANGYGKTTAKMSEQEKVALRYSFVLKQLEMASGDFVRTQDSWANQTRVLSLRFDELKASIGQGLINLFTPLIKVINSVLARLQVLASSFKSFTDMITGNVNSGNSSGFSSLAESATDVSGAVDGIGDSAKKTQKALRGLRNFDILNNMTSAKSDSSDTGSSANNIGMGAIDFESVSSSMDTAFSKSFEEFFKPLQNSWDRYGGEIFANIKKAVGNFKKLFKELGKSFKNVWTNGTAETALNHILSITSNIIETVGNLAGAFTNAWANAGNGNAIVQNMCDWYNNLLYIVDSISESITEFTSSPEFQEFANSTIETITAITDTISHVGDVLRELWDEYGKATFEQMLTTLAKLGTAINKVWKLIQPVVNWIIENVLKKVIERMIDRTKAFWEMLEGVADFVVGVFSGDWSRAWDGIKECFKGALHFMKAQFEVMFGPMIDKFKLGWETVKSVWQGAGNFFSGIWQGIKNAFGSVGTWFKDTFSKAWENVRNVFSTGGRVFDGIKDGIDRTFKIVVNKLIDGINRVIKIPFDKIKDALNKIRNVEIAGWHPFYGLPYISTPQIPRLAQGGYFKANQPTLAMVGDNMTQDEVVTPVPKMQDALRTVLNEEKGNTEIVSLLKQIINLLKNIGGETVLQIGEEELARAVIKGMRVLQAKSSKPILDFI
ncbi:hypothetical protein IJD44_07925 [bacterium]|nr:hypothetical protein [bacterium]